MIGNIKVGSVMFAHYIATMQKRNEYFYGNKKHGKRESREYIFEMGQQLARNMIKAGNVTVEVRGMHNLPEAGPVLYVANHKSIFDIVILLSILKEPCIFIGKKEVSSMPIVVKWFDALGCIYIDREDMRKSLEAIIEGINELKSGQSIVLFPEGTRTSGKEMKDFKEGSFKLATKTKVPIIPIALQDTYKIFEERKGVQKAKAYVNIGEMISQETLDKEVQKKLPQYVQNKVSELLKEITFDS